MTNIVSYVSIVDTMKRKDVRNIQIPDDIWVKTKILALKKSVPLKALVAEALQEKLNRENGK